MAPCEKEKQSTTNSSGQVEQREEPEDKDVILSFKNCLKPIEKTNFRIPELVTKTRL